MRLTEVEKYPHTQTCSMSLFPLTLIFCSPFLSPIFEVMGVPTLWPCFLSIYNFCLDDRKQFLSFTLFEAERKACESQNTHGHIHVYLCETHKLNTVGIYLYTWLCIDSSKQTFQLICNYLLSSNQTSLKTKLKKANKMTKYVSESPLMVKFHYFFSSLSFGLLKAAMCRRPHTHTNTAPHRLHHHKPQYYILFFSVGSLQKILIVSVAAIVEETLLAGPVVSFQGVSCLRCTKWFCSDLDLLFFCKLTLFRTSLLSTLEGEQSTLARLLSLHTLFSYCLYSSPSFSVLIRLLQY